jgi:hypothetical protein
LLACWCAEFADVIDSGSRFFFDRWIPGMYSMSLVFAFGFRIWFWFWFGVGSGFGFGFGFGFFVLFWFWLGCLFGCFF